MSHTILNDQMRLWAIKQASALIAQACDVEAH